MANTVFFPNTAVYISSYLCKSVVDSFLDMGLSPLLGFCSVIYKEMDFPFVSANKKGCLFRGETVKAVACWMRFYNGRGLNNIDSCYALTQIYRRNVRLVARLDIGMTQLWRF